MQETSTPVEVDPSDLSMFLETCIKLLRDSKVVECLQELINKCTRKEKVPDGHWVVRKIGKHKVRMKCEMMIIAQIVDYEMDQVIFDLGSDANVLLKKTWERMGISMPQWSAIQLRMANE